MRKSKAGEECFDCSETDGLVQVAQYWFCQPHVKKRQDATEKVSQRFSDMTRTSRQPSHRGGCLVICCDHIGPYSLLYL